MNHSVYIANQTHDYTRGAYAWAGHSEGPSQSFQIRREKELNRICHACLIQIRQVFNCHIMHYCNFSARHEKPEFLQMRSNSKMSVQIYIFILGCEKNDMYSTAISVKGLYISDASIPQAKYTVIVLCVWRPGKTLHMVKF